MTTATAARSRKARNHIVTVTQVREGVYSVTTTNGSGFVIPQWTRSYSSRDAAGTAGSHTVNALARFDTLDVLDTYCEELRRQVRELIGIRRALTAAERMALTAAEAELDALADLDELANAATLRTAA